MNLIGVSARSVSYYRRSHALVMLGISIAAAILCGSLIIGDSVRIGARGLSEDSAQSMREGKVRLVYPEIQGGRVIADVEVAELGDYFVGERAPVFIDTGKRKTIVIPAAYLFRRAGVNYVRLASGDEVVVQPGDAHDDDGAHNVEILAGLADGDKLVTP